MSCNANAIRCFKRKIYEVFLNKKCIWQYKKPFKIGVLLKMFMSVDIHLMDSALKFEIFIFVKLSNCTDWHIWPDLHYIWSADLSTVLCGQNHGKYKITHICWSFLHCNTYNCAEIVRMCTNQQCLQCSCQSHLRILEWSECWVCSVSKWMKLSVPWNLNKGLVQYLNHSIYIVQ